jgi:type I restriction enzyme S subunit
MNPITDHLDLWSSVYVKKATTGRGSNGKVSAYGVQKLRELILELAVRGKLVPQDSDDEPASVLLQQIAEEKSSLVKGGQIKKQKPLLQVSDDEMLFSLPEGWEWTRLGEVIEFVNGYAFKSSDFIGEGIGIVKIGDIQFLCQEFSQKLLRVLIVVYKF